MKAGGVVILCMHYVDTRVQVRHNEYHKKYGIHTCAKATTNTCTSQNGNTRSAECDMGTTLFLSSEYIYKTASKFAGQKCDLCFSTLMLLDAVT